MKRMSVAEQTIKRQIELLEIKQANVIRERDLLDREIDLYNSMMGDLNGELGRLRGRREEMSERNKTK